MSPPIRDGSGDSIGAIRLGDGSEIAEVRTGAGDVLFSGGGIPNSAVQNLKARDYDGGNNNWVANIGTDVPDASGDPSTTVVSIGGESFTAVRYDSSNADASQTTTQIATGDPIALVYSVAARTPNLQGQPQHYVDADSNDDFSHILNATKGGAPPHRILSRFGVGVRGDDADTSFHTFAYVIGSSNGGRLDRDGSTILSDGSATDPSLDGLTIAGRADIAVTHNLDALELTVLDNPTSQDISDEVSRQRSEYNI